jgi:hypothetical protein
MEPPGPLRFDISLHLAAAASLRTGPARTISSDSFLKHDPEKWVPVFRKDRAQIKEIEGDDDTKKSRHAPGRPFATFRNFIVFFG